MITFRKLEHTIVGTVNGKPFNVPRTAATLKYLTDARDTPKKENTAEDILTWLQNTRNVELAGSNKYLVFNPVTKQYFLELDGKRSKHPIPQGLVAYMEESFEKDIDFMPIVKAWARLLSNPRYSKQMGQYFETYINTMFVDYDEAEKLEKEQELDPEVAKNLATYQDIAITQEGLLATYKVAEIVTWKYEMVEQEDGTYKKERSQKYKPIPAVIDEVTGEVLEEEKFEKPEFLEDYVFTPAICKSGDKFFSGDKIGYVYEVGKMQYLPKDAKRNLSNTFGGGGLYIGGLKYVEGYRSQGTHVLTCFVNPADILSFQSQGHAIRVDALMPNNVWEEDIPLKGVYHSSEYGKVSEERIDAIVQDAIDNNYDLVEYQANAQGDLPQYPEDSCDDEELDAPF